MVQEEGVRLLFDLDQHGCKRQMFQLTTCSCARQKCFRLRAPCMYVYVCMYMHLAECLSVYVSVYLCVCLSVSAPACLSVCVCMHVIICMSACLPVCMHACKHAHEFASHEDTQQQRTQTTERPIPSHHVPDCSVSSGVDSAQDVAMNFMCLMSCHVQLKVCRCVHVHLHVHVYVYAYVYVCMLVWVYAYCTYGWLSKLGPLLGTPYRCRIILGTQKGTLILTTTHMHIPKSKI